MARRPDRHGARRPTAHRRFGAEGEAITVGGSEHFALPRLAPGLRDVEVYLGWFGTGSRPMQALSLVASQLTRVPGAARRAPGARARALVPGSTGGPDADRARAHRPVVVAEASTPPARC